MNTRDIISVLEERYMEDERVDTAVREFLEELRADWFNKLEGEEHDNDTNSVE